MPIRTVDKPTEMRWFPDGQTPEWGGAFPTVIVRYRGDQKMRQWMRVKRSPTSYLVPMTESECITAIHLFQRGSTVDPRVAKRLMKRLSHVLEQIREHKKNRRAERRSMAPSPKRSPARVNTDICVLNPDGVAAVTMTTEKPHAE